MIFLKSHLTVERRETLFSWLFLIIHHPTFWMVEVIHCKYLFRFLWRKGFFRWNLETKIFDIYNYTYLYTYINTCIHTYIHTYKHTYIHTYIHTHIYTCIHTYIYTHTTLLYSLYIHYDQILQVQHFVCETYYEDVWQT